MVLRESRVTILSLLSPWFWIYWKTPTKWAHCLIWQTKKRNPESNIRYLVSSGHPAIRSTRFWVSFHPFSPTATFLTLTKLVAMMHNGEIDLDAEYQRGMSSGNLTSGKRTNGGFRRSLVDWPTTRTHRLNHAKLLRPTYPLRKHSQESLTDIL